MITSSNITPWTPYNPQTLVQRPEVHVCVTVCERYRLFTSESPRCLLSISLSLGIPRLPVSIVGSGGRIQHVIKKRNYNSIYWKLIIYERPTNSSKLNFFQFIYILLHCVLTMSPLLYILLSTKYSKTHSVEQCGECNSICLMLIRAKNFVVCIRYGFGRPS